MEQVINTDLGEPLPDLKEIKLDKSAQAAKIMHSTVHENMLKRLNEEEPPIVVKEEQFGYDTQSEDQQQD